MIVPHRQLSPEALQGLIEEFVSRDGTDYGAVETPLAVKIGQILAQLEQGLCFIVFDDDSNSASIVPRDRLPSGR